MARDTVALPSVSAWPMHLIGAVVVLRAVAIATAIALGEWSSTRAFPTWIILLQIGVFSAPAILLLVSGWKDRRAWSLGVYFLDVACTLADPLVREWPDPSLLTATALVLRTDAFQGAMLWYFAAEFPRRSPVSWLARVYRVGYAVALVVGLALVGINLFPSSVTAPLDRGPAGWYFGVQYLALPILAITQWLKLRSLTREERARTYFLAIAIGAMAGCLLLVTLLRGALDLQLNPESAAAWALMFTISIGVLPAVATYAALVQRVLPISVILRAAAQYLLSKSIVYALAGLPFVAAAAYLFVNRERAVAAVFSGAAGALLLFGAAMGVALVMARRRLLQAIDRQFGRREVQASGPLMDLAAMLRGTHSIQDFTVVTTSAVRIVFDPRRHGVVIADDRGNLHAQDDRLPPLPPGGALAQLIGGSDQPIVVSLEEGSLLSRLNDLEREWLTLAEAALVAPMRGPGGELLGLIYLSERQSELPYSARDQQALAAIGSTCGLALYWLRAREKDGSATAADASDVAARECVECGLLHDADAIACRCGAPLQRAPVPLQLRGQLRFVRRIGTGAMGVVYEARDLAVHQPRAVKALPDTDAALMSRLRHEARTMASVSHANLATFYALESWRSAPLLVMEFCRQGTLADRLRRGALPVDQALAICGRIADALGYLHTHGVVHRDVKPSNIGFTDESSPKLLDFGLAKLVEGTLLRSTVNDASTFTASMSDSQGAIRGTPAYLSPEVLGGAAPSPGDDLWSLAVTLLEACTAVNPFKASTPAATAARVMVDDGRIASAVAPLPHAVAELIRGLLDRRLDRRPTSALELQQRVHLVHQGVHHG